MTSYKYTVRIGIMKFMKTNNLSKAMRLAEKQAARRPDLPVSVYEGGKKLHSWPIGRPSGLTIMQDMLDSMFNPKR